MHKWKDKVELSLDNRQIFFLFFGLSVVGCFVFALGIMTGRRLQWEPGQQVAAGPSSLSLLDEEEAEEDERFAFKSGLSQSDAEDIPPTRDPEVPPANEEEIAARKLAEQREAEQAQIDARIDEEQQILASAKVEQAKPEVAKQVAAAKPEAKKPAAAKPASKPEAAKPASKPEAAKPEQKSGGKRFTLQMKAFSRQEDADKLAEKLRHNGHDVRIEDQDVRGRVLYRVRLGSFESWEEALAAKATFEKSEHVIAYVVSL
ncbi:SPOR domain-containing protein [Pseudenhygromyxa sp. WMMC2535]|uniref:SPOR domain-containing protein n=1 Tax=Pseudenhygromyxa sp. WMMC2535 TaxID=2712867 RepID=UPI0015555CED|nr:SPOR domain-containing protein [Pseudenhygromyxa sp. WMMC2535]NVB41431.1 SPOR domain-containing protein [Pseudenhygromyxa sp. WMMC2535]